MAKTALSSELPKLILSTASPVVHCRLNAERDIPSGGAIAGFININGQDLDRRVAPPGGLGR
jgi:hypothetical protein